jgi:hypothetical protein
MERDEAATRLALRWFPRFAHRPVNLSAAEVFASSGRPIVASAGRSRHRRGAGHEQRKDESMRESYGTSGAVELSPTATRPGDDASRVRRILAISLTLAILGLVLMAWWTPG